MKFTSLIAAAALLAGASATAEAEHKRAVYGVCAVGFGGPCNGYNDPGNFDWLRTLQAQRENKKARREDVSNVAKRQTAICAVGAGGSCNGESDPGNFDISKWRQRFGTIDFGGDIARRQLLPGQMVRAGPWREGKAPWELQEKLNQAFEGRQNNAKRDAQLCAIGYGGSCNGGAPAWRGLLPAARSAGELAQRDVVSSLARRACAAGYEGFCNDAFFAPPQGFDEELLRNSARPVQIASKRDIYIGGSKEWAERQAQVQELYRLASGRQ